MRLVLSTATSPLIHLNLTANWPIIHRNLTASPPLNDRNSSVRLFLGSTVDPDVLYAYMHVSATRTSSCQPRMLDQITAAGTHVHVGIEVGVIFLAKDIENGVFQLNIRHIHSKQYGGRHRVSVACVVINVPSSTEKAKKTVRKPKRFWVREMFRRRHMHLH